MLDVNTYEGVLEQKLQASLVYSQIACFVYVSAYFISHWYVSQEHTKSLQKQQTSVLDHTFTLKRQVKILLATVFRLDFGEICSHFFWYTFVHYEEEKKY